MPSLNKVFLMGNLTRHPELRHIPNGKAVANFGLAVNSKFKSGDEWKEEVLFVEITVWGKSAENCCQYLSKGRPVFIEGRLKVDNWETSSGEKRGKMGVVANSVQFLGGKEDSKEAGHPNDDIQF